MRGHYYKYEGVIQLFKEFKWHQKAEKIEIKTSARPHLFQSADMPVILTKWEPRYHNDIAPFDHFALAELSPEEQERILFDKPIEQKAPETEQATPTTEQSPKKKQGSAYDQLRDDMLDMNHKIKDYNLDFLEKMKRAAESIDPKNPKPADVNIAKHLYNLGSSASKLQVNMIRSALAAKDVIMPKGNIIRNKDVADPDQETPSENNTPNNEQESNNHPQD